MTAPTTDPAPAPVVRPTRPAPSGLLHATAIIAAVGVLVALAGVAFLLRPVATPTQDCGTPLAFLAEGRVNELVSVDDPPAGITPAQAEANNAEPCRSRVADIAKPAGVFLLSGLVAAIAALVVEVTIRSVAWWKRRQRGPDGPVSPRNADWAQDQG